MASILYTNDLDMVNFLFDDFVNPARGGRGFIKEYTEGKIGRDILSRRYCGRMFSFLSAILIWY